MRSPISFLWQLQAVGMLLTYLLRNQVLNELEGEGKPVSLAGISLYDMYA